MNIVHTFSFALLSTFNLNTGEASFSSMSLQEAVFSEAVKLELRYNEGSPHYKYPLHAFITNVSDEAVQIQIDPGLLVDALDSTVQNMVVTEGKILVLKARESKEFQLAAMCINQNKSSGFKGNIYHLSKTSSKGLAELATFIAQHQYQFSEAQHAVWAFTNNLPVQDIYGPDTAMVLSLQQCLARIRKEPIPQMILPQSYMNNYYERKMEVEISGFFEYNIAKARTIEVVMFNDRGVMVRELLRSHVATPGKHKFEYSFDASAFEEDVYYVRLVMDDRVVLSRKIPLQAWKGTWD